MSTASHAVRRTKERLKEDSGFRRQADQALKRLNSSMQPYFFYYRRPILRSRAAQPPQLKSRTQPSVFLQAPWRSQLASYIDGGITRKRRKSGRPLSDDMKLSTEFHKKILYRQGAVPYKRVLAGGSKIGGEERTAIPSPGFDV